MYFVIQCATYNYVTRTIWLIIELQQYRIIFTLQRVVKALIKYSKKGSKIYTANTCINNNK